MPVLWKRPLTWPSAWYPNTLRRPFFLVPCTRSLWSPFFCVSLRSLRYSADGLVISAINDTFVQEQQNDWGWNYSTLFLPVSIMLVSGCWTLSHRKLTWEQKHTLLWVSCTEKSENVQHQQSWQVWNILCVFFPELQSDGPAVFQLSLLFGCWGQNRGFCFLFSTRLNDSIWGSEQSDRVQSVWRSELAPELPHRILSLKQEVSLNASGSTEAAP